MTPRHLAVVVWHLEGVIRMKSFTLHRYFWFCSRFATNCWRLQWNSSQVHSRSFSSGRPGWHDGSASWLKPTWARWVSLIKSFLTKFYLNLLSDLYDSSVAYLFQPPAGADIVQYCAVSTWKMPQHQLGHVACSCRRHYVALNFGCLCEYLASKFYISLILVISWHVRSHIDKNGGEILQGKYLITGLNLKSPIFAHVNNTIWPQMVRKSLLLPRI